MREFVRLIAGQTIKPFDCGDADLNEFLTVDSFLYLNQLLAVTYLLESETETIAFYSVSNDKVAYQDVPTNAQWNKFRKQFPREKRLRSYPCVKIGRLGVTKSHERQGIGTLLLDYLKGSFLDNNKTGCRFITVDAYQSAIDFYQKNGFDFLSEKDVQGKTRLMFFDLATLV